MEKIVLPRYLRSSTRKWVRRVLDTWQLEGHHVKLLITAGECWDRILEAREQVARDGPYFTDRWGAPRSHPALRDERDGRIAFARLLRELSLSEQPPDPRPPRLRS